MNISKLLLFFLISNRLILILLDLIVTFFRFHFNITSKCTLKNYSIIRLEQKKMKIGSFKHMHNSFVEIEII
jgi:hypothetical protein